MRRPKMAPTPEGRRLADTWVELVDVLGVAMPIDDIAQRRLDELASIAVIVKRAVVEPFAGKLSESLDDETRITILEVRESLLAEIDRFFGRKELAIAQWLEDQRFARRYIRASGRIMFHGSGCVTYLSDVEERHFRSCWKDPMRDLNERLLRA